MDRGAEQAVASGEGSPSLGDSPSSPLHGGISSSSWLARCCSRSTRSRRQLCHVPPEYFFRERQVDGVPVAWAADDACGPVDLDQVPIRVVEAEGERHAVVECHLDRHAPVEDPLVEGAEIRQ